MFFHQSERVKMKPAPVDSGKRKRADSDEDSDTPLSERYSTAVSSVENSHRVDR